MPWKKSKKGGRRGFAKRKPRKRVYRPKRRRMGKRKRAGTSSTTRAVNKTGWTAIPYQVRTVRPFQRVLTLRYAETFTCTPGVDPALQLGAFVYRIRADIPHNCLNFASTYNVGQAHIQGGFSVGQNPQALNSFNTYNNGIVIGAKCEIVAMPMHNTGVYASTDPVVYNAIFNNQAMLWGGADNRQNTFTVGNLVTDVSTPQDIANSRNVIIRYTETSNGSEARGCAMTLYYSPKKLYQVTDLRDKSSEFAFDTTGNWANTPTFPTNEAFFNFGLASPTPVPSAWNPATPLVTTTVPGIPRPHLISVKVTYRVIFYNPVGGTPNLPPA